VTEFYAYHRARDPDTGDVLFDDATGTWPGGAPMQQAVLAIWRTPLGHALRDPTYGTDYAELDVARPNAAARARAALTRALDRLTRRGRITELEVEVEIIDGGLVAEGRFVDPRDPQREVQTVKRKF
jgi:phage baseplate assembly protein W